MKALNEISFYVAFALGWAVIGYLVVQMFLQPELTQVEFIIAHKKYYAGAGLFFLGALIFEYNAKQIR